jgi:peptide/nickel transport system substrate-binding protein
VIRSDATVTLAVSHLPSELNPWTAAGSDPLVSMIMAQVWPQASIVDDRGNSTVCFAEVPNCPEPLFSIAEDVSVRPQTVDYVIEPKAKWSDGVRVTAADFITLWHAVVARAGILPVTEPIQGYLDIASITPSSNGSKMTVVFKRPFADWPALFTNVPPSHIANKGGFEAAFATSGRPKILAAGPYRISRIVPGKVIILDRNESFWGTPPSVKRIIFKVVTSESAILAGLTSGSITLAEMTPSAAVDGAVTASGQLVEQPASAPVLWQLAFNVAHPSLTPAVVRQAIAKIVNRHELIADTVGLAMAFGQTSGNRLFPAGAPGSQGNDGAYGAVALNEANALLTAAGDVVDSNGFVHTPNGQRLALSLVYPKEEPTMRGVASTIQAELLAAGITVTIHPVPLSTLLGKTLPSGSYDLALAPYPMSPYPSTTSSLYLDPVGPTPPPGVDPTAAAASSGTGALGAIPTSTTTTLPPRSITGANGTTAVPPLLLPTPARTEPGSVAVGTVTRNVLGFSDPGLTNLFAEASTQLNTAAEISLYDEIDTNLWADMPTLPLFQMPVVFVSRVALVNVSQSSSPAQYLWDAENWAVEKNPPPPTTTIP